MAISILAGEQMGPGTWSDSETFTQSTATAQRQLSNTIPVSFLGMGTATAGVVHNLYKITSTTTASGVEGDAVDGAWKYVMATATGQAAVFIEFDSGVRLPFGLSLQSNSTATGGPDQVHASATGLWVFQSNDDYMLLRFLNGAWRWIDGVGATQAAAT